MVKQIITEALLADILSVSRATIEKWKIIGKIKPSKNGEYYLEDLQHFDPIKWIINSKWEEQQEITPIRKYISIELFAGAGGLAIGLEKAGFHNIALNELDKDSCKTLRFNRPHWNVIEKDISKVDFSDYSQDSVDLLSGGFPCQAFSYAGNKLGFEDVRGTLFFEFARAIKELKPKVFLGENVRGLLNHDQGKTLETIKSIVGELGYILIEPKVLKAIFYRVPQKRERLFLIGIRKDLFKYTNFRWPDPFSKIMTLRDALKKGDLYDQDCPPSSGQNYPPKKQKVMEMVPPGGCWIDLPEDVKREYMGKSYFLGGGKTGIARRLSFDLPSLTLTCSPAQKQTERCHPEETRPLTIREYARVQTFPDDWNFIGSISSQYRQIGNAVPVNLAWALGNKLVAVLNQIEKRVDNHSMSLNHVKNKQQMNLFDCDFYVQKK